MSLPPDDHRRLIPFRRIPGGGGAAPGVNPLRIVNVMRGTGAVGQRRILIPVRPVDRQDRREDDVIVLDDEEKVKMQGYDEFPPVLYPQAAVPQRASALPPSYAHYSVPTNRVPAKRTIAYDQTAATGHLPRIKNINGQGMPLPRPVAPSPLYQKVPSPLLKKDTRRQDPLAFEFEANSLKAASVHKRKSLLERKNGRSIVIPPQVIAAAENCLVLLRKFREQVWQATRNESQVVNGVDKFMMAEETYNQLEDAAKKLIVNNRTVPIIKLRALHLNQELDGDGTDGWNMADVIERENAQEMKAAYYGAVYDDLFRVVRTPPCASSWDSGNPIQCHAEFIATLKEVMSTDRYKKIHGYHMLIIQEDLRQSTFEIEYGSRGFNNEFTLLRAVITVIDGCVGTIVFLGENETAVDSKSGQPRTRSVHTFLHLISKNAMQSMLNNPKSAVLNTVANLSSMLGFLHIYRKAFMSPCGECGKLLRDFLPPSRMVTLHSPFRFVHEGCDSRTKTVV